MVEEVEWMLLIRVVDAFQSNLRQGEVTPISGNDGAGRDKGSRLKRRTSTPAWKLFG
jgi:hypothetical protein